MKVGRFMVQYGLHHPAVLNVIGYNTLPHTRAHKDQVRVRIGLYTIFWGAHEYYRGHSTEIILAIVFFINFFDGVERLPTKISCITTHDLTTTVERRGRDTNEMCDVTKTM